MARVLRGRKALRAVLKPALPHSRCHCYRSRRLRLLAYPMTPKDLAKAILIDWRRTHGLTQKDAAKLLGVSFSTYQRYERRGIKVAEAERIAKIEPR
jgi:DNA-binding XRE family transcriptional regulator